MLNISFTSSICIRRKGNAFALYQVEEAISRTVSPLALCPQALRELKARASVKRLSTSTADLSFDMVFVPFGQIPEDCVISSEMAVIKTAYYARAACPVLLTISNYVETDEKAGNFFTYYGVEKQVRA
jgi:hypothetical protein